MKRKFKSMPSFVGWWHVLKNDFQIWGCKILYTYIDIHTYVYMCVFWEIMTSYLCVPVFREAESIYKDFSEVWTVAQTCLLVALPPKPYSTCLPPKPYSTCFHFSFDISMFESFILQYSSKVVCYCIVVIQIVCWCCHVSCI